MSQAVSAVSKAASNVASSVNSEQISEIRLYTKFDYINLSQISELTEATVKAVAAANAGISTAVSNVQSSAASTIMHDLPCF